MLNEVKNPENIRLVNAAITPLDSSVAAPARRGGATSE